MLNALRLLLQLYTASNRRIPEIKHDVKLNSREYSSNLDAVITVGNSRKYGKVKLIGLHNCYKTEKKRLIKLHYYFGERQRNLGDYTKPKIHNS